MTTQTKNMTEAPAATVVETTREMNRPVFEPPADVIEKPEAIHVLLDLPGVDQKGLDVSIEEHVLTIRGKSAEVGPVPGSCIREEILPADYQRTFRLGADIDEARVSANLKNGTLRLVLPKSEHAKPKQISVQTE